MVYVLDDIWTALQTLPQSIVYQFVMAFMMPILFAPLYIILHTLSLIIQLINALINLYNIIVNIPNIFTVLTVYYYYYFPSAWSTPLIVGIGLVFYWSLSYFIKSWIPGES